MAKIHWSVYVIIGFFVSTLSYKLDYNKLIFFFYIGIIFILIGIAKLIFGNVNKKEDKPKKIQTQKQHMQNFKRCSRCGNIARINDRFCSICGARVWN